MFVLGLHCIGRTLKDYMNSHVIAEEFYRFLLLTLLSKRSLEGHPWALKKELRCCNSLIFNVDQPGLEPGTSRL